MALTTVKLLGPLGQRFGREFTLDINSPREAMQLLAVNLAGFEQHLIDSHEQGMGYRVVDHRGLAWSGDRTEDELDYPVGQAVLIIVPAIYGSGGPLFRILAGVALIGVGLFTGFVPLALVGASLVLGGISQLLSPNPSNKEGKRSYFFNGPVNTTNQGNPVPLCYGRLIVGSHVISAGITLDKIIPAVTTYNVNTSGGNETSRLSNDPASDDFYIEQVNDPGGTYPDLPAARDAVRWYCSGGVCFVTTDPGAAYATKSECEAALVPGLYEGGQVDGASYIVRISTQAAYEKGIFSDNCTLIGPDSQEIALTGPITSVKERKISPCQGSTGSGADINGVEIAAKFGTFSLIYGTRRVCSSQEVSVSRQDGTSKEDDVAAGGSPPKRCP